MQDFIRLFIRIGPGVWTCVRNGEFHGPNGRIQVALGTTFTKGTNFMGVDVAALLDDEHGMINGHESSRIPEAFQGIRRPSPRKGRD
jgi:hypothetical protein